MLPRAIVLGYHGCSRDLARQVTAGETTLHPSGNNYDWLGHGVYFWADDPKRALEWAANQHGPSAGVLGAAIDLGSCLHLADRNCLTYLQEAYEQAANSAVCLCPSTPVPASPIANWTARFLKPFTSCENCVTCRPSTLSRPILLKEENCIPGPRSGHWTTYRFVSEIPNRSWAGFCLRIEAR